MKTSIRGLDAFLLGFAGAILGLCVTGLVIGVPLPHPESVTALSAILGFLGAGFLAYFAGAQIVAIRDAASAQVRGAEKAAKEQADTLAFYERLRFTHYFFDSKDIREPADFLDSVMNSSGGDLTVARQYVAAKPLEAQRQLNNIVSALGSAARYLELGVIVEDVFLDRVALRALFALFLFREQAVAYFSKTDSSAVTAIRSLLSRSEKFLRKHEPGLLISFPELFMLTSVYAK